jgi:hypothetical protein
VLACYFPSVEEMVVSGADRAVDGVPRDFAIAHEYGHHVANTRAAAALPAIEAGTPRWATYERVCQLTRRGRLFPGNQGAHYWQDPEEAFAQSYARLNRPDDRVSWQYTPLLQPTPAALAKIHADVAHPWSAPVEATWDGSVTAPLADTAPATGVRSGALAVGAGRALGPRGWLATRLVRTPLDGPVSVSLRATPGARLVAELHDPAGGRTLARAATDPRRRGLALLLQLRPRRPPPASPLHLRSGRLRNGNRKALRAHSSRHTHRDEGRRRLPPGAGDRTASREPAAAPQLRYTYDFAEAVREGSGGEHPMAIGRRRMTHPWRGKGG